MRRKSYIDGFCKVAAAHGVDPRTLARYAIEKKAEGEGGYLDKIKDLLGQANNWYNEQSEGVKGLIGAGAGALAGTGIGAALAGRKGIRSGAVLGALGGGYAAVDWKALAKALGDLGEQAKARERAEAIKGSSSDA